MPDKYIVVFDTNIFLQALVSRGGPAIECLDYFEQGRITIAVSRATLAEVEDVLARPHLCLKYPQLMDGRVATLLDRLLYRGIYLRQVKQHFIYPRPQRRTAIESRH